MIFGWSKTRCSPIGVDFGADSLKLLQIVPGDPPQLIALGYAEVPIQARSDPSARFAFFHDAIKSLMKTQGFKGKQAIISIPAYQTLIQQVQIDRTEESEALLQIEMLLRQRLNVDPSRMVIRHKNVAQIVRDGANKDEVLVFAAGKDTVMRHIDVARRAGLDVIGMESEPNCILKAFEHLSRGDVENQRASAFIDIGAATTKVIIAHGMDMVFAKMIHAAGDHFTRHRAQTANVDFAHARLQRRQEAGADRPPARSASAVALAEPPRAASGIPALDAAMAAEPSRISHHGGKAPGESDGDAMESLIDEMQLCFRYHQSVFAGKPMERLVFLGGEANQVAVCQRIAKSVRIAAQLGDPLARMIRPAGVKPAVGLEINKPQPGWAVPMGLCLSDGIL